MGIISISSEINNEKLEITLQDNDSSGYTVINVDGLGSPDAVINTAGGSTFDGTVFNSASISKRIINLTLVVNGRGDEEDTNRMALYKWFPTKKEILFGVTTTGRDAIISAIVETAPLAMFSKNENVVVTLICPDPFFRARQTTNLTFYGTQPLFEFPFSNESLVSPLIIMGELLSVVQQIINYPGDIETGIVFTLRVVDEGVTDLVVSNQTNGTAIFIDTTVVSTIVGGPLTIGDEITIDTRVGHKNVVLVRGGFEYNIINALDIWTKWVELTPGDNHIVLAAATGVEGISMSMQYDVLYLGV